MAIFRRTCTYIWRATVSPAQFKKINTRTMANELNNGINNKRARNEEDVPTIGTHDGTFHCDEALACFMLLKLPEYKNAKIVRSRNINLLREKCNIIVDVGGEFDHERKWYDHHQKSFNSTINMLRPELTEEFQIRLSSAGLIYAYYGERVIDNIMQDEANIILTKEQLQLCFVQIYRNFISEIDAIDNGVSMYEYDEKPRYKIHTHISARVSHLNPSWEKPATEAETDALFQKAMALVGKEFVDKVLDIGGSWIKAREYVREALLSAKSVYKTGEILVLERFCPWKAHLSDLEREYNCVGVPKMIIFCDGNENWRVAGVPISPDSYLGRKFLPEPWRGLRSEELSEVNGIKGCVFVHHNGFIGGALTKEAAIAMAIKSIEWTDKVQKD